MDGWTWDNLGTTELPEYGPSLSVTASDNAGMTTPPNLGDWNDMDVAGLSFLQDATLRKAAESADVSGNSHYQVGASTHCIFDSRSDECSDTKPAVAPGCSMKTNSCLQELSSHLYNLNKWTANHRPGSSTIPDLDVGEFLAVQKAITGVCEQIIQHCTSCISRCEIAQLLLLNVEQLGHLHVAVAVREGVVAAQAPQDASNKPGELSKHSDVTPPHLSSASNTISVGNFIIEDVHDRDVIV